MSFDLVIKSSLYRTMSWMYRATPQRTMTIIRNKTMLRMAM